MFADLQKQAQQFLKQNASSILTAGGVVGTVATAILTGRASFKAARLIEEEYDTRISETRGNNTGSEIVEADMLSKTEIVKLVGLEFIPPVLTGSATIASIVMANRVSAKQAAALAAAYGLAEGRLTEYREKVAEKLSPQKEAKIQAELAQDAVNRTPGHGQIIIMDGEVLCFDKSTGRYFRGSMEKINRAVNAVNAEILQHDYADASFFYAELELEPTTWTDDVGWTSPEQVELTISTVLTLDEKPCIAIDFQSSPKPDFIRRSY